MVDERPGVWPWAARCAASAAARVYRQLIGARHRAYDRGWLPSFALGRPTLSVGNLSAGGTGKTPLVAYLVRELARKGHRPAVLLRGYRSSRPVGGKAARPAIGDVTPWSDEAAELEQRVHGLGGVVVRPDPDRVRAAEGILREHPSTDVFVLDDGFQHRRVQRDLDIVLISVRRGLCGGRLLPRGLLREPPEGLSRADVVVLTRVEPDADTSCLEAEVRRYIRAETPVLRCRHEVGGLDSLDGERFSTTRLAGRRVFLVAAIGDPAAFARTVSTLDADIVGQWWGPDHHRYTPDDWAEIGRRARAAGAGVLLTTGKDATKLRQLGPCGAAGETDDGLPVWVLRVDVRFYGDDGSTLLQRASDAIERASATKGPRGG